MQTISILSSMLDRPTKAMQQARETPRSAWLPALLLGISALVLIRVAAPYQIEIANERSAQMIERLTSNMSAEQLATVRAASRPVTMSTYLVSGIAGALVLMALGWVLRGGIIHLSSLATGNTGSWGATFSVVLWSMLPFFLRDLVQMAYVGINRTAVEHQGMSFLVASGDWLRDGQNIVYAALSRLDPFILLHIVLLGLGIALLAHTDRIKGIVWSTVLWALFTALNLIPVAITAALGRGLTG